MVDSILDITNNLSLQASNVEKIRFNADGSIVSTNTPAVTSGTGTPSSTPSKIGDIYVNTSTKTTYVATGTSSSSDWTSSGGSGSGVTFTQPESSPITMAQNDIAIVTHPSVTDNKKLISVTEEVPGSTGVSNSSLDFDLADEGSYTQEDASTGTQFTGTAVTLRGVSSAAAFRYIRVLIDTSNAGTNNGDITVSELKALTSGGTNRALGKSVTATSYDGSWGPANVTDGISIGYNNSWATAPQSGKDPNGSQYATIDLGAEYSDIATMEVSTHEGSGFAAMTGYRIAISTNNTDFSVIKTYTGMPATSRTDTFTVASLSYPTAQPYYVTTGTNSIGLVTVAKIATCSITQTTPTNTSIKWLISFDGKTTWKYWNSSSWVTATGGLADLQTSGNTYTEIQTGLTNLTLAGTETYLDFAMDLATTSAALTPEVSQITITYDEPSIWSTVSMTCWSDSISNWGSGQCVYTSSSVSPSQTAFKKLSSGTNSVYLTVVT